MADSGILYCTLQSVGRRICNIRFLYVQGTNNTVLICKHKSFHFRYKTGWLEKGEYNCPKSSPLDSCRDLLMCSSSSMSNSTWFTDMEILLCSALESTTLLFNPSGIKSFKPKFKATFSIAWNKNASLPPNLCSVRSFISS